MIGDTSITVYRKFYDETLKDDIWAYFVLHGVNWFSGQKSALTSSKYDKFIVRIPVQSLINTFVQKMYAENFYEKNLLLTENMKDSKGFYIFDEKARLIINEEDVVIKGALNINSVWQARQSVPVYESFKVVSLADNRFGTRYMHHWKIGGL